MIENNKNFPIQVYLNDKAPFVGGKVKVNNITISKTKTTIYTQKELLKLKPIEKYLVVEYSKEIVVPTTNTNIEVSKEIEIEVKKDDNSTKVEVEKEIKVENKTTKKSVKKEVKVEIEVENNEEPKTDL